MRDLVPIVLFICMFGAIFGIYYMHSRENMAMLEKGFNPRVKYSGPQVFKVLRYGLLFVGSGLGLLIAYLIDFNMPHKGIEIGDNPTIYFALVAIGGGMGLLISFFVEKKWIDKNSSSNNNA